MIAGRRTDRGNYIWIDQSILLGAAELDILDNMIKNRFLIDHDLLPLLTQKSIDNMWQRIAYMLRTKHTITADEVQGRYAAPWQKEPLP